jgi:hypothetical protein
LVADMPDEALQNGAVFNTEQPTRFWTHTMVPSRIRAIHTTLARIDDTADRVRSRVRSTIGAVVAFVGGLSAAIEWILRSRHRARRT